MCSRLVCSRETLLCCKSFGINAKIFSIGQRVDEETCVRIRDCGLSRRSHDGKVFDSIFMF